MASELDALRGETVVETVANITRRYFGDDVEVPNDIISAVLILAAKIQSSTSIDEDNATTVSNSEIADLVTD